MYQYSNPSTKHSGARIPRRYQMVDLDDYLQLQLLLQQEKERRQAIIAEQERRRAAEQELRRRSEERRQLEEALARLYYLQQLRRHQRLEEERRVRREQRYRAELMAALQAAGEEEYRRRLLGAIERQKLWEAARVKREDNVREQRKARSGEEDRRANLEALLRHLLGEAEPEQQEEDSEDDKVPESLGDDGHAWKIYYRPTPSKLPAARKSAAKSTPSTAGRREKLKDHVVPLQTIIESLLEQAAAEESSAAASKQQQKQKQQQQQQAKDFEKFIGSVFPDQQQSASGTKAGETSKSTEPKQPTAPAMSEKDAASKIESWYKNAHDAQAISQVTHQLGVLGEIASQLDKLQNGYEQAVFKTPLAFNDLDAAELSTQSHGSRNWLYYEDEIMKILVRLDTVESLGSDIIRERRKELVKKASALLDRLDEYKHEELERVSIQSEAEGSESSEKVGDSETSGKAEPYFIPEPAQQQESKAQPPEIKEESSTSVVESEPQQPEVSEEFSTSVVVGSELQRPEIKEESSTFIVIEAEPQQPEISEESSASVVVESELQQTEVNQESSTSAAAEFESQQPEINEDLSASAVVVDADVAAAPASQSEESSTGAAITTTATTLPLPTPNHPHPENPNATTVDDADGDDNDDAVVKQREEDEFVVV